MWNDCDNTVLYWFPLFNIYSCSVSHPLSLIQSCLSVLSPLPVYSHVLLHVLSLSPRSLLCSHVCLSPSWCQACVSLSESWCECFLLFYFVNPSSHVHCVQFCFPILLCASLSLMCSHVFPLSWLSLSVYIVSVFPGPFSGGLFTHSCVSMLLFRFPSVFPVLVLIINSSFSLVFLSLYCLPISQANFDNLLCFLRK